MKIHVGVLPFAYVVVKKGKAVSSDELKEFPGNRFARFWIPDAYAFVETISKTSVGKILKSDLRDKYNGSIRNSVNHLSPGKPKA